MCTSFDGRKSFSEIRDLRAGGAEDADVVDGVDVEMLRFEELGIVDCGEDGMAEVRARLRGCMRSRSSESSSEDSVADAEW